MRMYRELSMSRCSARVAMARPGLPWADGVVTCSRHRLDLGQNGHRHLSTPTPCRILKLLSQAAADATQSLAGVSTAAHGALSSIHM